MMNEGRQGACLKTMQNRLIFDENRLSLRELQKEKPDFTQLNN